MYEKDVDITAFEREDFIKFVFDHEVPDGQENAWYWDEKYGEFMVKDPTKLLQYFTFICTHFNEMVSLFSLDQINQGIWFLLLEPIYLGDYLTREKLSQELRVECIQSMYFVFRDFVAKTDKKIPPNCFYMWWDFLSTCFWTKVETQYLNKNPQLIEQLDTMLMKSSGEEILKFFGDHSVGIIGLFTDDDILIHNTMFATLAKILELNDTRAQHDALHGLGHLKHPKGKRLIQDYIDKTSSKLSQKRLKWLESCRDGTIK